MYQQLQATGLPVELGTGGRTRYNRMRLGLKKGHWIDAAVVGTSTPERLSVRGVRPLLIRATGHGNRQMCGTNAAGFPIRHRQRAKRFGGWQTGDVVQAVIPNGKHAGRHTGRLTIRQRPCFRLNGIDVHPKYLFQLQWADGYDYAHGASSGATSPAG